MRVSVGLIAVLVAVASLAQRPLQAQEKSTNTSLRSDCAASPEDQPSGPEVSIDEITFSDSLQMPLPEQEAIADAVKQNTHGTSVEIVIEEALERVKNGWQDRGYFKAEVTGETKTLTSNPVSQRIALSVHVKEGARYRLRRISFRNNRAITDTDLLRGLFPIADGDIFSREKIAAGLANVRKAYDQLGYINFTSIPDTQFNEVSRLITLVVDVDEGKQFRLDKVVVLGLEDPEREGILKSISSQPGQIFTGKAWEDSVLRSAPMLPECPCREQQKLDEKAGLVTLTLDFRPCPAN